MIVQHFTARVDLLNAKLRLGVVICDVDIVVVVIHIHARRIRVAAVDQRRFRLDMVSNVLAVLVDDVIGVLEVIRCWLSHMARIIKLLLLLLKLQSLLLLLLAVLGRIAGLLAFSFTLPFLAIVRCALRPGRIKRKEK